MVALALSLHCPLLGPPEGELCVTEAGRPVLCVTLAHSPYPLQWACAVLFWGIKGGVVKMQCPSRTATARSPSKPPPPIANLRLTWTHPWPPLAPEDHLKLRSEISLSLSASHCQEEWEHFKSAWVPTPERRHETTRVIIQRPSATKHDHWQQLPPLLLVAAGRLT